MSVDLQGTHQRNFRIPLFCPVYVLITNDVYEWRKNGMDDAIFQEVSVRRLRIQSSFVDKIVALTPKISRLVYFNYKLHWKYFKLD